MSTDQNLKIQKVKCPHCKKEILWLPDNPFRPFCSDRCRLIDLGAWAEQKYAVATQATEIPLDEFDESDI